MNETIKTILEKHVSSAFITLNPAVAEGINSAIIEICEEQKIESANQVGNNSLSACVEVLNSKNIAE